jgi:hypothetical protein
MKNVLINDLTSAYLNTKFKKNGKLSNSTFFNLDFELFTTVNHN